jgi:hypothetical protein
MSVIVAMPHVKSITPKYDDAKQSFDTTSSQAELGN